MFSHAWNSIASYSVMVQYEQTATYKAAVELLLTVYITPSALISMQKSAVLCIYTAHITNAHT